MTIQELYIFFQPLTQPLGTLCLILLAAGSVVATFIWFVRRFWMYIVAAGLLVVVAAFVSLAWNVA